MRCGWDQWRELCIAAAFEDNPEKLNGLVEEIKRQLTDRQKELTDRIFEDLARRPLPSTAHKSWIQ